MVGTSPWMATAPLLTKIVPPTVRETTIVLSKSSPTTLSSPPAAENEAVTASITRESRGSTTGTLRRRWPSPIARRAHLPGICFNFNDDCLNHDIAMRPILRVNTRGAYDSDGPRHAPGRPPTAVPE